MSIVESLLSEAEGLNTSYGNFEVPTSASDNGSSIIADRVELLTGPASVSCSRHGQPPVVFLLQLVLTRFYQNMGQVVHEWYKAG